MLAESSLGHLLELIAARTPAPGGGSAAACAVAISASLEQMAAQFMPAGTERARELHSTAGGLRAAAVQLAERELHSYGDLLTARRLPADEAGRGRRVTEALDEAIAAPFELCRCAADAAEVGAELVREGNPNLAGDAVCATLLAEAACRAAATLITLNLADRPRDPRAAEAQALAERAEDARRRALGAGG